MNKATMNLRITELNEKLKSKTTMTQLKKLKTKQKEIV